MGLKEGPCFLYVLYWGNSIWWRSEKLALSQSYPQAFSAPLENLSHWLWMTFPGRWLCRGGAKTVRTWWPIEGTAGSSPTKFFPRVTSSGGVGQLDMGCHRCRQVLSGLDGKIPIKWKKLNDMIYCLKEITSINHSTTWSHLRGVYKQKGYLLRK